MPCPDGKGVETGNIMKHLETDSGEHLHLVLDLPPSFVTLRFNEDRGKQIHLRKAKETHSTHAQQVMEPEVSILHTLYIK